MVIIDTNCLIIYILGLIQPSLINSNKHTSIYEEEDFYFLLTLISSHDNLLVLPNIWTEVDNLLNRSLKGKFKDRYINVVREIIKINVEKYIESQKAFSDPNIFTLGLTDTLILREAKNCKLLITSDGDLSIRAFAEGIEVIDLGRYKNNQFKSYKK